MIADAQTLPKTRRLRRPAEFAAVLRSGMRYRDQWFTTVALRRGHEGRLGVTVSRKISRRAVDRNRIKRQIRESFRMHRWQTEGWDVVVTAQPAAGGAERGLLRRSLEQHWDKLRRRCASSSSP